MSEERVRSYPGIPPASVFAGSEGSPVVINSLTGAAYVLTAAGSVECIGMKANGTFGQGVKIDNAFGWKDLLGPINVSVTGANRPLLTAYGANTEDWAFAAGDKYSPIKFHIPHDYAPGTDIFLHTHWSHNGTNISGSLVVDYHYTYAKGHSQASFAAEKMVTLTVGSLNITNTPNCLQRIDEIQMSSAGGSATLLDTNLLEPDGVILLHFVTSTIPTITGGAAKPFIHFVDIHHQSTNLPTRNKTPNFWST